MAAHCLDSLVRLTFRVPEEQSPDQHSRLTALADWKWFQQSVDQGLPLDAAKHHGPNRSNRIDITQTVCCAYATTKRDFSVLTSSPSSLDRIGRRHLSGIGPSVDRNCSMPSADFHRSGEPAVSHNQITASLSNETTGVRPIAYTPTTCTIFPTLDGINELTTIARSPGLQFIVYLLCNRWPKWPERL
jgi:hypothetical protein